MGQTDTLGHQACELLKQMIAIPSVSRDEQAVADLLFDYLITKGCKPQRLHNNVWVANQPNVNGPTLLLNSHIDTVKPVSGWTLNPFTATENDDHIYGLGSNDAGASVVSLLTTFLYFADRPLPLNLVFVASAEEEISGANGIESVLPQLGTIDFGIVGEPTQLQPATAEKGLLVIDGVTLGRAGHAARNDGDNAIYKALDDIKRLQQFQFEKTSATLGNVHINVTQIEAGTQHNVIPDNCRFVIDVRTTDAYSNAETLDALRKVVLSSELTPRSLRLNPSGIDAAHPIMKAIKRLHLQPFGSPTLSDQALMNFPTIKIGPGDSTRSHKADEYIGKLEIFDAIEVYKQLIETLAQEFEQEKR